MVFKNLHEYRQIAGVCLKAILLVLFIITLLLFVALLPRVQGLRSGPYNTKPLPGTAGGD